MGRKIVLLTLVAFGLLAIPSQPEPQFSCTFPTSPNNIVQDGDRIRLVAMNWGDRQAVVEKAIEEVIPLLEDSPFLSWLPARGGGTVPVYPATPQLAACWEREYPGKKVYGSFRAVSGPYGPGIYLLPNLDHLTLKVTLAHESVHAFWTSNELIPRLVSVPIIVGDIKMLPRGSP